MVNAKVTYVKTNRRHATPPIIRFPKPLSNGKPSTATCHSTDRSQLAISSVDSTYIIINHSPLGTLASPSPSHLPAMSTKQQHSLPEFFFKVYVARHSSQQMLIPEGFTEYLASVKAAADARITGANKDTWVVEWVKEGGEMYFKQGWKAFVQGNLIAENDFLFFKYHGDLQFSVRIFDDVTKCEKILPVRAKNSLGRGTQVGVGRKLSQEGKRSTGGGSHTAGRGPLFTVNEEEPQRIRIAVKPYFVKKMTKSSVGGCPLFKIPASFVWENSLQYQRDEKMIIRTEESYWTVNIVCNQNGTILSGGWGAFVRDNNIKEGDIWTFKLEDRLEMMAHASSGGM